MGNAFVAISDDVSAPYWNAAGLSLLRRKEAALMHAEQFGGIVNYNFAGFATPLEGGAGLGIIMIRVGIGDIKYTALEHPDEPLSDANRPGVKRTVSNEDYVLYLSHGRQMRPGLSLGASVKLIRRRIGDNTAFGYGIDSGLLYRLGAFSLGVNLRNLTSSPVHWDTGTMDRILPSIDLALAYTQPVSFLGNKVTGVVGAYRDGEVNSHNGVETLNMGLEYWYSEALAVRLGVVSAKLTAGLGMRLYDRVGVDYAFTQHRALGNSHRVSASLWL